MPIITSAHLHPRQAQRVGKTAQASQRGETRQLHVLLRPLHQRARPPHHRTCVGEMDELCNAYYRLDMIRLLSIFTLILVSTLTVTSTFLYLRLHSRPSPATSYLHSLTHPTPPHHHPTLTPSNLQLHPHFLPRSPPHLPRSSRDCAVAHSTASPTTPPCDPSTPTHTSNRRSPPGYSQREEQISFCCAADH